jgi:hypothetical protein
MKRRGISDTVLIVAILAVAAVAAPVAYNLTRPAGGGAVPAPSPLLTPLAQFRGKPFAAEVGKAHRDFAAVLAMHPLNSSGELKAKLMAFHQLLYADKKDALPGFSAAFEQSWQASFGIADSQLDNTKAVAFLESVASAMGG